MCRDQQTEVLRPQHPSIHPPSWQKHHPFVWAEEQTWLPPHWYHPLLLNSKEYLSFMGKPLSVREKKKCWAQRSHPIAVESSEIFAAATKDLVWNTSCLVIINVILTREFIIHLLEAYRICHGIITIFTTLLIITYTDRKFSSFFTFKMCFTTKFSTPRSGVLISLEKMKLIQIQIRTEKEKTEQENSPLWHATTLCE